MTTTPQISGLDPNSMQVLATTSTQQLLFDYGNTQDFFILTLGPPAVLQQTSPALAQAFYGNFGVTVISNPFGFNPYQGKISGLV